VIDDIKNDITRFNYTSKARLPKTIQIQVKIQTVKKRSRIYCDQRSRNYQKHAFQFVNSRVAAEYPTNDGKHTPMRGHPLFIAQHATAACCRRCLQKWHGIEKGRALNPEEIEYVVALIMG